MELGYQLSLSGAFDSAVEAYQEAARANEGDVRAMTGVVYCQVRKYLCISRLWHCSLDRFLVKLLSIISIHQASSKCTLANNIRCSTGERKIQYTA